jgi:hypothetical protein
MSETKWSSIKDEVRQTEGTGAWVESWGSSKYGLAPLVTSALFLRLSFPRPNARAFYVTHYYQPSLGTYCEQHLGSAQLYRLVRGWGQISPFEPLQGSLMSQPTS